jgi:hypothetical protein
MVKMVFLTDFPRASARVAEFGVVIYNSERVHTANIGNGAILTHDTAESNAYSESRCNPDCYVAVVDNLGHPQIVYKNGEMVA